MQPCRHQSTKFIWGNVPTSFPRGSIGILAQLGERSTEDAEVHGSMNSITNNGVFGRPVRQYDKTDEIPSHH